VILRRYVEHILAGRYDRAGIERPRLEPGDHELLGTLVHDRARRPRLFPDPRHLAVALGFRIVPRAPRGLCGEGTAHGIIAYRWHADPRVRGLLILHGIAHAVLDREIGRTNDADAWAVTATVAVCSRALPIARENPSAAAVHVPEWMVLSRLVSAKLCRVAGL
jgi:hypothetical protein